MEWQETCSCWLYSKITCGLHFPEPAHPSVPIRPELRVLRCSLPLRGDEDFSCPARTLDPRGSRTAQPQGPGPPSPLTVCLSSSSGLTGHSPRRENSGACPTADARVRAERRMLGLASGWLSSYSPLSYFPRGLCGQRDGRVEEDLRTSWVPTTSLRLCISGEGRPHCIPG